MSIEVELPDGRTVVIDTDDPKAAASAAHAFQTKSVSGPPAPVIDTPPEVPGAELTAAPQPAAPPAPPFYGNPEDAPPVFPNADQPYQAPDNRRKLKLGVQDVGRGAADVAGLPVDLATTALNGLSYGTEKIINNAIPGVSDVHVPRISAPYGGSENLKDVASQAADFTGLGTIPWDQRSPTEKTVGRSAELATGAMLPAAALREAALVKDAIPTRFPTFGDAFTQPYSGGSARPVIGDVAGGAGAGTAIETTQEHMPDDWKTNWKGDLATLVASLVGGVGGSTAANIRTAPGSVYRSIRDFVSPDPNLPMVNGVPFTRSEVNQAAEFLQNTSDNPAVAAANIKDRAGEARAAGLPVPTSGALSGDIGLGAVERGLRVNDPVPFTRADQNVRTAAADKMTAMNDPNAKPDVLPDFFDKEAATRRGTADAAVSAAEQKSLAATAAEQARVAPYTELPAKSTSSEALDKAVVDETMKPRQAIKNQKFAEIPDAERSVAPLAAAAAKVRESLGSLNDPDSILPQGTLQRIEALAPKTTVVDSGEPKTFKVDEQGVSEQTSGGPTETTTGGTVSFQDMNKLRPELTDAIRTARQSGNYTLADNIKALKREIGNEAQRMADEGSPQAAGALQYFKDEFAPYFGDGTIGGKLKDAINKDTDRVNTPPSTTADRFLNVASGGKEAAADLSKILSIAPNPEAGKQAVRNYVLADLGKTVKADGTIDPNRLRAWVKSRGDVLQSFPEVDGEVQKLLQDVVNNRAKSNTTAAELKDAVKNAKLTEQDINQGALGLVLNKNPSNAVRDVLGSGNPEKAMTDILKVVAKDPAALAGWKQAVKDHINDTIRGSNTQMVNGEELPVQYARMKSMFDKNAGALSKVFTSEEMNAAQQVQKELSYYGALSRGSTVNSPTAENITNSRLFKGAEIAWRFWRGQIAGGGEMKGIKNSLRFSMNENDGVHQVMMKFAFDPESAQYLLTHPVPPKDVPGRNVWLNRLMGVTAPERTEPDKGADSKP